MPLLAPDRARRVFLDALAGGETEPPAPYGHGYTVLCGGGHFADLSDFPVWGGVVVRGLRSHAAGRYQFEPATWRNVAEELRLTDFGHDTQDQAAWWLASTEYQRLAKRDLDEDCQSVTLAWMIDALHPTWPSVNGAFLRRFIARATTGSL